MSAPSFALYPLTGLVVLGITDAGNLLSHPKCGASWEGFALGAVIRHTRAQRDECHFWALHSGAELDFLLVRGDQRLGFEVKLTRSPKVTASMRTAQEALALDHLYVLCHAPDQAAPWPLAQGITAVPLHTVASALPLR